jgi:hypothetical protein
MQQPSGKPSQPSRTKAAAVQQSADAKAASLPPEEFQAYVATQSVALDRANREPAGLEATLWKRLRASRQTTDEAIFGVVAAVALYESPSASSPGKKDANGRLFPATHRLISDLLPTLFGRYALQARLHRQNAELYLVEGRSKEAAEELDAAAKLLTVLTTALERHRLEAQTVLGETLLAAHQTKPAEAAFLEVLSFSFYTFTGADLTAAKDLYLRAGRGVIAARQGDAVALRNTYFWEFAQPELYPLRDQALARAAQTPNSDTGNTGNGGGTPVKQP